MTPDIIHSLYQFRDYPLDLIRPLCREYALLKLGVSHSVQYFADQLLPAVERIIADNPQYESWVLTAPPASRLPTAAILLSGSICTSLQSKYPGGRFSMVRLYNQQTENSMDGNARHLLQFSQYSRSNWADRIALIRKNHFEISPEDFEGRGIIFINDINVTGASQEHINEVFASVFPDKVNWLYIIDCDKGMGRKHPHLENELNNIGIQSVKDFAAILAEYDMRHTAKCISKLFSYNLDELEQLLDCLNADQKNRLWAAIQTEYLYEGDVYVEKRTLLGKHCVLKEGGG